MTICCQDACVPLTPAWLSGVKNQYGKTLNVAKIHIIYEKCSLQEKNNCTRAFFFSCGLLSPCYAFNKLFITPYVFSMAYMMICCDDIIFLQCVSVNG